MKEGMSIADEFTERLDSFPGTPSGFKTMPKNIFNKMAGKVKTPEDIEQMKSIIADIYGHRSSVNANSMDEFLKKCCSIDAIAMLDFFRYHRQMFYYPHPSVLDKYVNHFITQEDYENTTKKFIEACLDEHWLKKTDKFYN